MTLVVKDRVRETSTSTGTGSFVLAGAVFGYQSFAAIGDGNTTYYTIVDTATGDWEVGVGTYTLATTTLSRDTVLASTNSNTFVPFTAGTKDVFVSYPAEVAVDTEIIQSLSNKELISPLITLGGTQGTAGQVPVSQGAGLPPTWGAGGVTMSEVNNAAITFAIVLGGT